MSRDTSRLGHDSDYLTRREAQERLAAEAAADLAARRAHESLADRYAAQLNADVPVGSGVKATRRG